MCEKLAAIGKEVSEELGVSITQEDVFDVMYLCWRKMKVIKKPISYLPILFKCELKIHFQAKAINLISRACQEAKKEAENYVFDMPLLPLPSEVS